MLYFGSCFPPSENLVLTSFFKRLTKTTVINQLQVQLVTPAPNQNKTGHSYCSQLVFSAKLSYFFPPILLFSLSHLLKLMKQAEAGTGSIFKVSAPEEACDFVPKRRSPLRACTSGSLICPRGECQKTDPFHLLRGSLLIPVSRIYLISMMLFDDSESLLSSSLFAVHLALFSPYHHFFDS